ncbi:unnamed protein product [Porites lobata]|uniref:Small ribosomal subunit protein uS7 domain-containing protein n=1 Tax=Porites lobata TaxID=104759 RepID=A0ABN8Q3U2_9CNID|nr:unnamed protein product [Porites lobata]
MAFRTILSRRKISDGHGVPWIPLVRFRFYRLSKSPSGTVKVFPKRRNTKGSGGYQDGATTKTKGINKPCKPIVGVRGMNRGGKVYQVPIPLPPQRRRFLAIKWLITAAREQQKTNENARMYKKLAKELLNAYNNEGTVIKKKRELHRRAEDNRAYAHYRWW